MTQLSETPVRVLIINPNTSQHMTDALRPVVEELGYHNVSITLPNHFTHITFISLFSLCYSYTTQHNYHDLAIMQI